PVLALQPELVVAQHRIRLDEGVAGGARVEQVAGKRQLLGRRSAAGNRPRVEDDDLVAGLREIGAGDEAVVAAARDDDVGDGTHETLAAPFPLRADTWPPRYRSAISGFSSTSRARPARRTRPLSMTTPWVAAPRPMRTFCRTR